MTFSSCAWGEAATKHRLERVDSDQWWMVRGMGKIPGDEEQVRGGEDDEGGEWRHACCRGRDMRGFREAGKTSR